MQRSILVAGNWKMNGNLASTNKLVSNILTGVETSEYVAGVDLLVCTPSVYLQHAKQLIAAACINNNAVIAVGAQNVSSHNSGAYTGEISLDMLQDISCDYVLVGHSERRELYCESNADVASKFAACVAAQNNCKAEISVIPILCIGETLAEREAGQTEQVLSQQIDAVLDLVGINGFKQAVVAYEPVWAIGTGVTASPSQAQTVHAFIRAKLSKLDHEVSTALQILYGGSMKPSNAFDLLSQNDIDGGLIGGASLEADSFLGIWQAACNVVQGISD